MQVTFDSKHIILIAAVFFLFLAAGVYFFSNSDAQSSNALTQSNTRSQSSSTPKSQTTVQPTTKQEVVTVNAQRMWTDTGVEFRAGDTVRIEASGQVTGSTRSTDAADKLVGPDGWGYEPKFSREGKDPSDRLVLPNTSFMSLIGKVGSQGQAFLVGSSYNFKASNQGRLYLGINDSLIYNGQVMNEVSQPYLDNGGFFTAKITIQR